MSHLNSLRIALCGSLSLAIPLVAWATAETDSPNTPQQSSTTSSVVVAEERPITVAYLMPSDNSPVLAANKIVLNGLTSANMFKPNIRLLMVETSLDNNLENQLKAAVLAGADVAIGPLSRDRVDELLKMPELPLPVVALNTPTTLQGEADTQLLMMSLSNELEASYIANEAADTIESLKNPMARVVIIRDATKNDYRVTAGYEAALQARHIPYQILPIDLTTINAQRKLFSEEMNADLKAQYAHEIAELSRLPKTDENLQRLKELKDAQRIAEVQGTPEFPVALLSMGATEAGLVVGRLPRKTQIMGVSLLNPGDPETNPTASSLVYDLNNAVFVDAPLLIKYDAQGFEAKFQTPMPYSLPAKRLFALGLDALSIAEQWAHQVPNIKLAGEAGQWSGDVASSAILTRKPATVLIQDGALQLLTIEPAPAKATQ